MALQLELSTSKARSELRDAEAAIRQLELSLNSLGSVQGLSNLNKQLSGMAGINPAIVGSLQSLGTALTQVGNVSGNIKGVSAELNKIGRIDVSKVAGNVQQLSNALANLRVPPSLGRTITELGLLRGALNNAVAPAQKLSSALSAIKTPNINAGGLNTYGAQANSAAQGVMSFSAALRGATPLLAGFGVALGAQNFGQFISGAMEAVSSIESLSASMGAVETSFGDTQKAASAGADGMEFIRKIAKETRVPIESLIQTFPSLNAAMRASGRSAEDVEGVFRNMSVAGRVLNLSADDMKGIFRALQQIFSKGKVQAEELQNQLGERFPGAVAIMADALGITTAELSKMMEQGQVTATSLEDFARRVEKIFGEGLAQALLKPTAALAALGNAFFEIKLAFGLEFWGQAQGAVEALIASMEDGGGIARLLSALGTLSGVITSVLIHALVLGAEHSTALGAALAVLAGPAIVAAIYSAATAAGAMAAAMLSASIASWQAAAAMAVIPARAAAIGAASVGMYLLSTAAGVAAGAMALLGAGVLGFSIGVAAIGAVVALAAAAFYVWYNELDVLAGLLNAYPETMAFFQAAFETAATVITDVWTAIVDVATAAGEGIVAVWESVVAAFNYVGGAAQALFDYFFKIQEGATGAAEGMTDAKASAEKAAGSVGGAAESAEQAATGFNSAGKEAAGAEGGLNAAAGAASSLSGDFNSSARAARAAASAYKAAAAAAREFAAAKRSAGGGGGGGDGGGSADSFEIGGIVGNPGQPTAPMRAGRFGSGPKLATGTADTTSFSHLSGAGGGIPSVLHPGEAVVPLEGGNIPVAISGAGGGGQDTAFLAKILEGVGGTKYEVSRVWDAVDTQTRLLDGWLGRMNNTLTTTLDVLLSTQADHILHKRDIVAAIDNMRGALVDKLGSLSFSGGGGGGGSVGGGSGGGLSSDLQLAIRNAESAIAKLEKDSAAEKQAIADAPKYTFKGGFMPGATGSMYDGYVGYAKQAALGLGRKTTKGDLWAPVLQQLGVPPSNPEVLLSKYDSEFLMQLPQELLDYAKGGNGGKRSGFSKGTANTSAHMGGASSMLATLHRDEAVIPLPDGRSVPVILSGPSMERGAAQTQSPRQISPPAATRALFSSDPMAMSGTYSGADYGRNAGDVRRKGSANNAASIVMHIHTNDADSFRKSENQILREFGGKLTQAQRRVGGKTVVDDPTKRISG